MMRGHFSQRAALAAAVGCSLLFALGAAARAAELKVMSTVALTPTLGDLTPKYESSSGNKLTIIYSTIADLKKRIDAGETADLMILSRPVPMICRPRARLPRAASSTWENPMSQSACVPVRPSPTSAQRKS